MSDNPHPDDHAAWEKRIKEINKASRDRKAARNHAALAAEQKRQQETSKR